MLYVCVSITVGVVHFFLAIMRADEESLSGNSEIFKQSARSHTLGDLSLHLFICESEHKVCICASEHKVCICESEYKVCICASENKVCICASEHKVCICASEHKVCICASEHKVCICASEHKLCICASEHKVCIFVLLKNVITNSNFVSPYSILRWYLQFKNFVFSVM